MHNIADAYPTAASNAMNNTRRSMDVTTKDFRLEYLVSAVSLSGAASEVFYYSGNYEGGVEVEVDGPAVFDVDEDRGIVSISASPGASVGDKVTLTLSGK